MIDRFVLVIGAMKAGTTTLFELLAQHPQIAPCREKEPEFLTDRARWQQGLAEYAKLWDWQPGRHRWALEASTKYTKLPGWPSAVMATSRYDAEFRFVYLVRHPIDRIRSEYLHALPSGWVQEPIHERLSPYVVMHSNYHLQLHPYVVAHGRESILIATFDELQEQPAALTRRIWKWLELDDSLPFAPVGRRNAGENHREVLRAQVRARTGLAAAAADAEVERAITPNAAQVAQIREWLGPDLATFRSQWGVDVWALKSKLAGARRAALPERGRETS